jgi:ornithine--oxo-acid transaminase
MRLGLLTKETHKQVIRIAPPLTIETEEVDWLVAQFRKVL